MIWLLDALSAPFHTFAWDGILEGSINFATCVFLVGGAFLMYTAVKEIGHMLSMDHLGHDRFSVAGHSLGGLLSLELASMAPDRVTKAGVLASGRVRSPRTMAVFEALLTLRKQANGEEMWLRALYPWIFGQAFFETPENIDMALEAALASPTRKRWTTWNIRSPPSAVFGPRRRWITSLVRR